MGQHGRQLHRADPSAVVIISAHSSSAAFSHSLQQLGSTVRPLKFACVGTGGLQVSLDPRDHQASDFVDLTVLGAQRWGP